MCNIRDVFHVVIRKQQQQQQQQQQQKKKTKKKNKKKKQKKKKQKNVCGCCFHFSFKMLYRTFTWRLPIIFSGYFHRASRTGHHLSKDRDQNKRKKGHSLCGTLWVYIVFIGLVLALMVD